MKKKGNAPMNPNPVSVSIPADAASLLDSGVLKQQIISQLRARGGTKSLGDPKALLQGLIKDTIEALLEVEIEE
jgi:hypothetical protein